MQTVQRENKIKALQTYLMEKGLDTIDLRPDGENVLEVLGGGRLVITPQDIEYLTETSYLTAQEQVGSQTRYAVHDVAYWEIYSSEND